MTPAAIRDVVRDELGAIAPEIEFEVLDPATELRAQVDLDSMDFLNLVTALHQRLGVDIPEADYPQLATLDSLVAYLASRLGGSV